MIKNWQSYVFVPSGELIRAAEIAVLTAALEVVGQVSSLSDVRTYAIAAGLAGLNALIAFAKGRVPKA